MHPRPTDARPTLPAFVLALALLGAFAVVGGMVSGTVLAIFFVPLFFVIVQKLFGRKKQATDSGAPVTSPVLLEGH